MAKQLKKFSKRNENRNSYYPDDRMLPKARSKVASFQLQKILLLSSCLKFGSTQSGSSYFRNLTSLPFLGLVVHKDHDVVINVAALSLLVLQGGHLRLEQLHFVNLIFQVPVLLFHDGFHLGMFVGQALNIGSALSEVILQLLDFFPVLLILVFKCLKDKK